jgi:uncharacterized protein YukE
LYWTGQGSTVFPMSFHASLCPYARSLARAAAAVDGVLDEVGAVTGPEVWRGPAATTFRADLATWRSLVAELAAGLRAAARTAADGA